MDVANSQSEEGRISHSGS